MFKASTKSGKIILVTGANKQQETQVISMSAGPTQFERVTEDIAGAALEREF
jgi:hypothetical protein